MAGPTVIPFGDPKAQKRWAAFLFNDAVKKMYFEKKFVSTGDSAPIQRLTDLESDAGDTISFDLCVQLRERPTYGDNVLEGKEENLRFFSDTVKIDQMRHGVSVGGKMTRKRTAHNLREIGKDRLGDYWAKFVDQMTFIYLSGARGINQDYIESTTWPGHAENPIQAPSASHLLYGGTATAKNNVTTSDKMTRETIEKAVTKASMMRALDPNVANMMPMMINGESHYVCVMSKFQEYDLRTADTTGWLDIQKRAAAAEGRNNPIFKGGLGMINECVLHAHESVIRFSDYGSGVNLPASRALFLGRQAGVVAYGSSSGLRFSWTEETKDHGNQPKVASGVIMGAKKTRFNDNDFGVMAIDTYAKDPSAA